MNFAVDFDGTMVTNKYPEIGYPKWNVINFCKKRQEMGDNIILWTCRTGEYLESAIKYLKDMCAFTPNYINENAPYDHMLYPIEGRKIGADYYIDDKALNVEDLYRIDDESIPEWSETLRDKIKNYIIRNKLYIKNINDELIDVETFADAITFNLIHKDK